MPWANYDLWGKLIMRLQLFWPVNNENPFSLWSALHWRIFWCISSIHEEDVDASSSWQELGRDVPPSGSKWPMQIPKALQRVETVCMWQQFAGGRSLPLRATGDQEVHDECAYRSWTRGKWDLTNGVPAVVPDFCSGGRFGMRRVLRWSW